MIDAYGLAPTDKARIRMRRTRADLSGAYVWPRADLGTLITGLQWLALTSRIDDQLDEDDRTEKLSARVAAVDEPAARRDQPPTAGRTAPRAARGHRGTADAVLDHLAAEVAVDAPGQQAVLDRLLDWMLVCTLREWFDRPGGEPPTWWAAQRDPVVGDALRLLHAEPAAPWTVAALAEGTGVSRSTLAKRFADLVGEPPLTYLTRRRMTLAADLLIEQESATVADIARAVGYSDPFGFSVAFKRVRGLNPSEFRRTATMASPAAERSAPTGPSPLVVDGESNKLVEASR